MQLLFCEDEYLTRIGVMQTIPWEEIGITHVDCAKNGQEGMEMLATHPDILLTDIRMPFVSGSSLRQSTLPVSPTRTPPPFPRPRALCSEKSATGMRI